MPKPNREDCDKCLGTGQKVPECDTCDGKGWVDDPSDGMITDRECPDCCNEQCDECVL